MHLTNYSVNKHAPGYVENTNAEIDDVGSKWSLTALWEWMRSHNIDDRSIWSRVKDIVVKTLLAMETSATAGFEMYVPYRHS
jgi:hypothetical protein